MRIHHTALRHGIAAPDIYHALENWCFASEPDESIPAKQVLLGFDSKGRLLELVVLHLDSGGQLVIHAMKARRSYLNLLT